MKLHAARRAMDLVRRNMRLRASLSIADNGETTLLEAAADAHDYWRRRCPVDEDDIAAERITWDVLAEWMKSNPIHGHESDRPEWADRDQRETGGAQMRSLIVATIDAVVSRRRLGGAEICPHDVLDELVAVRDRMRAG